MFTSFVQIYAIILPYNFDLYREIKMNPREIVLGGYQSFLEGDMEALGSIYHDKCIIK